MSIIDNLGGIRARVLNGKTLKQTFNYLLSEIESSKGNLHLANILELISDELEKKDIHSIICIINDKRNEIVVRHVNFPGQFKTVFTTKNLKVLDFKKFQKYQEVIKTKESVFSTNRISQFKKLIPHSDKLFHTFPETNSIITPLVLRGEIIGTLEILSPDLKKEDQEIINDFVNKLVISITNNILFHEIRESEQRYRDLFENSSDGLIFFDIKEKCFRESNIAMRKLSGYTVDELKQLHFLRFFDKKERKRISELINSISKKSSVLPIKFCSKIQTKNNGTRTCNVEIGSQIQKGEICFSFQDVTETKKIERALKDSEEKYRKLVDNAEDGVLVLNSEGYVEFLNKGLTQILEGEKEDILNKHFKNFIFEEDLAMITNNFQDRISGKDVVSNYDFRIKTLKGDIKYINYSGSVIKKAGKITGIQAMLRDISKTKDMQEKIKKTKRHYEKVLDSIQDEIVVIDQDFKIASCNRIFAKNTGIPITKIPGRNCRDIFKEYKRGIFDSYCSKNGCKYDCATSRVFKSGKPIYFVEKSIDNKGQEVFSGVSIFPIINNEETYQTVMTIKDITESKKAEEENLRLTEFNQKILNSSPVSIVVLNKEGRMILANGMAKQIMERPNKKVLGRKLINTKEMKANQDVVEKYNNLLKNGESFYYDNLSYTSDIDGQLKFLNIIAVPLYDKNKNVDGAISMAIDNTEKIIAQQKLESLNRDLEEKVQSRTHELDLINKELSKVLELKSKFISDASHELRTPLTIIQGNLDLAIHEAIMNQNEVPEAFSLISKEVEQMTGILSDLTMLTNADASSEQISYDKIDLKMITTAVIQSLIVVANKKNIKLKNLSTEKVQIIGDETKLEKLLLNIIRNAIKYTEDGGIVEIFARNNHNYALVSVKDNGIGIPSADLPYIFERFYRVDKARSRKEGGTGLGLSICKWIAEAHKGSISVESKEGEGSTFTVKIPYDLRQL